MDVPIIDFHDAGDSHEDMSQVNEDIIKRLGKNVVQTLKSYGFCYLKNHGINDKIVSDYMAASNAFFKLSASEKEPYAFSNLLKFGWIPLEGLKSNPKRQHGDLNEAFLYSPGAAKCFNSLPSVNGFEDITRSFYATASDLALRFCDVLSLGLDMPIDFVRKAHQQLGTAESLSPTKTLLYPALDQSLTPKEGQVRMGAHSDTGTVSFIFQDDAGGLEIVHSEVDIVHARPIPGTILVVIGALLQRWTADYPLETIHRVPIPTEKEHMKKVRQSLVFFLVPDEDHVIKCMDGSDIYEPITHKEYLKFRLSEIDGK